MNNFRLYQSKLCQTSQAMLVKVPGALLLLTLLLFVGPALGEMDEEISRGGEVIVEPVKLLSDRELGDLVAPVALYPDDLLAIMLPAASYPIQIVQAARFLQARENDPSLEPDEAWDDTIIALLNYPEVIALLNADLDWTWRLGEAVLVQEADLIAAVSEFRERARIAGNLESDDHQTVVIDDEGAIEIRPADPEVIYVPYYEPEAVTVYQRQQVYHYYPQAYPVYYYPFAAGHTFSTGHFWGVTSAFSIGWHTHRLHLHHYGYDGHPYYNYHYYDPFYHRRPHQWLSFDYSRHHTRHRDGKKHHRHHEGNRWQPDQVRAGSRPHDPDTNHRDWRDKRDPDRKGRNRPRLAQSDVPVKGNWRRIHDRSVSEDRNRNQERGGSSPEDSDDDHRDSRDKGDSDRESRHGRLAQSDVPVRGNWRRIYDRSGSEDRNRNQERGGSRPDSDDDHRDSRDKRDTDREGRHGRFAQSNVPVRDNWRRIYGRPVEKIADRNKEQGRVNKKMVVREPRRRDQPVNRTRERITRTEESNRPRRVQVDSRQRTIFVAANSRGAKTERAVSSQAGIRKTRTTQSRVKKAEVRRERAPRVRSAPPAKAKQQPRETKSDNRAAIKRKHRSRERKHQ